MDSPASGTCCKLFDQHFSPRSTINYSYPGRSCFSPAEPTVKTNLTYRSGMYCTSRKWVCFSFLLLFQRLILSPGHTQYFLAKVLTTAMTRHRERLPLDRRWTLRSLLSSRPLLWSSANGLVCLSLRLGWSKSWLWTGFICYIWLIYGCLVARTHVRSVCRCVDANRSVCAWSELKPTLNTSHLPLTPEGYDATCSLFPELDFTRNTFQFDHYGNGVQSFD